MNLKEVIKKFDFYLFCNTDRAQNLRYGGICLPSDNILIFSWSYDIYRLSIIDLKNNYQHENNTTIRDEINNIMHICLNGIYFVS